MRQIENEEKPSNFFMWQKNKIRTKKTTKLKNKNGEIKTEDKEILKIAKEFYSGPYKKVQTNEQEQ